MKNLICVLLMTPCFLVARTYHPKDLSALAEERAPLIKMHMEQKSAAISQIKQSRLIANPIFGVQAGELRSGGQAGRVTDLTLNQPIPWPGKRFAAINSAKILEKMSNVDLAEAKLLVHHSVTLLSVEQAVLMELEKHHGERKTRFSAINRFLRSRPQASPRQKIEKDLIENQIRLVENQMFEIETKRESLSDQLAALTGEEHPQVELDWTVMPQVPAKIEFIKQLENNFGYKRSEQMSELAKNKIQEAKYLAKPDILVGVNYRKEDVAPVNHFYHANLAVVIPIIDHGQHAEQTARAQARREEANKEIALIEARATLSRSYQALQSAHRASSSFPIKNLDKEEQRFREIEDAFKKGRIEVSTYIHSDSQIHDSIEVAYSSYLKFYTSLSEVLMVTGQRMEVQ